MTKVFSIDSAHTNREPNELNKIQYITKSGSKYYFETLKHVYGLYDILLVEMYRN